MVKIHPQDPPSPKFYPVHDRIPGQNTLCTSHYHAWSFVFVNIFEQFHRAANMFFLFTAILQAIPAISPLDPIMGFVSLVVMLAISMVKVGYEDFLRHRADDAVNNQKVTLWQPEGEKQLKWMDVQPGDILILNNDDQFPADCVIIEAKSHDGRCRIETAALDGEADLKYRHRVVEDVDIKSSSFLIEYSQPVPELTNFTGCIIMNDASKYVLSTSHFVPRGCTLRKTEQVHALVIYTGNDTKIIMNSAKPRYKYTELDAFLLKFVIVIFIILLLISIALTVGSFFWAKNNHSQGYLKLEELSNVHYFYQVFSWILILNYFIPLCVYSSLDLVRFFLSFMITYDNDLMDSEDKRSVCRNSDLVSSIGRITHVLTDKTGTLTKNIMTFKVAGFHDIVLGFPKMIGEDEEDETDTISTVSVLDDNSSYEDSEQTTTTQLDSERLLSFSQQDIEYIVNNVKINNEILFFLYTIVLCNTASTSVNPNYYEKDEVKQAFPDFEFSYELPPPELVARFPYSITYLTGSPDELCLLHLARECGYILYDVTLSTVQVIIDGQLVEFERPVAFEFSSKRRRGSVITKIDNKYYMLMKGADSVISQLSNEHDDLYGYVADISTCGLRTLVYARKEINDYERIIQQYVQCKMMTSGSERAIEQLANEVECNMEIIAISGVEDELQDEVGLTLKRLRMANIKVWMLTGDKLSTALNIGKTTELISLNDQVIQVSLDDSQDLFKSLGIFNYDNTVLALEGSTFAAFMNMEDVASTFLDLASKCSAIIIARCEPSQKGNVVRAFKSHQKSNKILAVGDGANDVDMIRAADVGVGVEGKEGSEAVMSSDFSIPSYRHLASLLIVHGIWCVNRVSLLILLTFYKNAMIGILQIYYGIFNGFSATSTFDSAFLTCFNILLTIPQLFFICVFEQDLTSKYALAVPHIYHECQKYGGLGAARLAEFYTLAVLHSAMIFFFSYFESNAVTISAEGSTFDYAIFTQITGWSTLFVFTVTLLTRFKTFTIIHILLYIACVIIYAFIEFVYSFTDELFSDIVAILFSMPRIWFTIPFCVGSCIVIDLILISFRTRFSPSLSNAVAELEYAAGYGRITL
ncbi:phospholipid-translocating P-type ATPase, flippase family protein [Tritrichomonas foetus]|uniref:Phospholipid-translocating P-type ATPase, flippase family protein n=1 Tax=Tritrichomonas foetus TaxID=1144522 RepID=A0A1J4JBW9_9EUKA|nr:phospholipid-translocating P-type ATPase, flippase family protein [Tritrichomonas foetus]|eukprot:OHS95743.1 phospholipid-translocating P-type ATPase, flippase family protein [Tritrichomonas foetus]